jgi:serine/threonine-protein kinase
VFEQRMTGDVVGNYRLGRKLGSGGMGDVWAAEHILLGQKVAIKFLLPDVSSDEDIVKRFFDEAKAAARISDPGIVAVFDFGWHDRGAYIVMEHLAGEAVSTRLATRRPSLAQSLTIAQQVALTMSVAHAQGIIHRDLKPENLFLVPDAAMPGAERVKILDFGIAKLVVGDRTASNTRSDVFMGTPTHMSPEQCRGAAGVDHRTDIYALGCILFQLACGRLPFLGPTMSDTIASHLLEPPPAPSSIDPSIPPAVDAIILRCLAKTPGDRYATMTELARALAAAAGTPLEVSTLPPIAVPPAHAVADPVASTELPAVGGQSTTLGSGAAQSIARPRTGGGRTARITVALLVAAAGVTALIVTRGGSSETPAARDAAGSAASRGAVDAAVDAGPPDAVPAAVTADAAPPPDARKKKRGRPDDTPDLYDNR